MTKYLHAAVTILSLINPVICGAIFLKASAGKSTREKMADATRASLCIAVILCLAALSGAQILKLFGVSLSAFQVAGGLVLVWMGLSMLRGATSPTTADATVSENSSNSSLSPLILFAASPGTITGVITLSVSHSQDRIPFTALFAVLIALSVTWLVLVLTSRKSGAAEQGLMHDVTTRFMGLIVLSMGVQFALAGLKEFFHQANL